MFLRIFYISILIFSFIFTGCEKKSMTEPENTIPANIHEYSSKVVYQKGVIIKYNGSLYQATTTVRRIMPSVVYVASKDNILNPWVASSLRYADNMFSSGVAKIKNWDEKTVYTSGDIVASDEKYYKAMWYNVGREPNLASSQGAWNEITYEEANAMNFIKWNNSKITDLNNTPINVNASNNTAEKLPVEGTYKLQNATTADAKPGVVLDGNTVLEYRWSYDIAYIENNVCTYGSKYYRAKWWNKGEPPRNAITPNELWDTPWQEITPDLFRQLTTDTVPIGKLPANSVSYVDPSDIYNTSKTQGYVEEWDWDSITDPSSTDMENEGVYMWRVKQEFNKVAITPPTDITTENSSDLLSTIDGLLGNGKWEQIFPNATTTSYYSYANFRDAMDKLCQYVYLTVIHKYGSIEYKKVFVLNKVVKKIRLISQSDYFYTGSTTANLYPAVYKAINFAYIGGAVNNDKLRVLAAFLAHCAYQSSNYWERSLNSKSFDKPLFSPITFNSDTDKYFNEAGNQLVNKIAFSMILNEDAKYKGQTTPNFVEFNREFPPSEGVSYHGRGPYLIEGSYTYGLLSAIIFGKSDILLKEPNAILNGKSGLTGTFIANINSGSLGFLTGLISFMLEKNNIPSVHDVLILNDSNGVYNENKVKVKKEESRGQAGFGWSVNIINGREEYNKDYVNERADNYNPALGIRVLNYTFFSHLFGAKIDNSEKLDTLGYYPY